MIYFRTMCNHCWFPQLMKISSIPFLHVVNPGFSFKYNMYKARGGARSLSENFIVNLRTFLGCMIKLMRVFSDRHWDPPYTQQPLTYLDGQSF